MLDAILLGVVVVVLVSVAAGLSETRRSSRSVAFYYTGGGENSEETLKHLIMASSMSLNGLFYHTWLGYKVGVYSIAVQAFWALSFFWLISQRQNLLGFARRSSLFGTLREQFGNTTAMLCIVASCVSLTILVGWEVAIASSLAEDLAELDSGDAMLFAISLVVVTALYTYRGGILANARANRLQNYLKMASFVLILCGSAYVLLTDGKTIQDAGYTYKVGTDFLKLNPIDAAIGLFGLGALMCNLFFSAMWQPADPTVWQNVSSGVSSGAKNDEVLKKSLMGGALLVFIFPGLAGTAFGMSLASVSDLTDQSIMSALFNILYNLPIGTVLVFAIAAMLTASMLSTVDGMLLGVSYSLNRDLLSRSDEKEALFGRTEFPVDYRPKQKESDSLFIGKVLVLGAAVLSLGVFWLVQNSYIGLFEVVYLAVIGQMAIAPLVLVTLFRRSHAKNSLSETPNWLPISLGLAAGAICLILHFAKANNGMAFVAESPVIGGIPWIILAPPLTFISTLLSYFLLKAFRRRN